MNTDLGRRMRERAITHHHDEPDVQATLIQHAEALEALNENLDNKISAKYALSIWTRADAYWRKVTREQT